ncbi:MAG: hypothetical protein ABSA83_21390 [Verrucomicrobiota bacterium]|jgi:hypothetical protein
MSKQTIEVEQQLHKLAKTIRDTYDTTEQLLVKAQGIGTATIAEAVLCGQAALKAKKLCGHGRWMEWVAKHCKKCSQPTLNRYMRMANSSHVINLKDCKSLRQAYILVGIIPEIEPGEVPQDSPPTPEMRAELAAARQMPSSAPTPDATPATAPATKGQQAQKEPPDAAVRRAETYVDGLLTILKVMTPSEREDVKPVLKPIGEWL